MKVERQQNVTHLSLPPRYYQCSPGLNRLVRSVFRNPLQCSHHLTSHLEREFRQKEMDKIRQIVSCNKNLDKRWCKGGGFWTRSICSKRLPFSQFVVYLEHMNTTHCKKITFIAYLPRFELPNIGKYFLHRNLQEIKQQNYSA